MTILCMNLNAAIDKTALVSPFKLGQIHRPQQLIALPGGKGANVARALRTFGASPVVSGWVGGFAGHFIESALNAEGIETAFVQTDAESRTCLSIVDEANGTLTELYERGEAIPPDKLAALRTWFRANVGSYEAVTLCGSLPAGVPTNFYAELIGIAHEQNIPALLDTSGEALKLGITAKPRLVKPNEHEFAALIGSTPDNLESSIAEARALSRRYSTIIILSLGEDGAIAIDGDQAVQAKPPNIDVRSAVGSGDCLLGALALGLTRGDSLANALADGVAAGTANTLQYGAGVFKVDDFHRLRAQITVTELDG
jgi:tagatose 6-phosphate kinase